MVKPINPWRGVLHNHLFVRILMMFLAILIPAVIAMGFIYWDSLKNAQQKAEIEIVQNMKTAITEIDTNFRNINEIGYILSTDRNFAEIDLSEPDVAADINVINKSLMTFSKMMIMVDEFVSEAAIYTQEDYTLTTSGLFPYDLYFDKFHSFESYSGDFFREMLYERERYKILPASNLSINDSDNVKITKVIPVTMFFRLNRGYSNFIFDVKTEAVNDILKNYSTYEETFFFALDKDNNPVLDVPENMDQTELMNKVNSIEVKDSAKKVVINGENYLTCADISYYTGFTFFSLTPIAVLNNEINRILITAIVIISIIVLAGILMSVFFSMYIFAPIKKIKEMLKDDSVSENVLRLNTFGDLENEINLLLSERQALETEHTSFMQRYLEYAVPLLLTGSEPGGTSVLRSIFVSQLGFNGGPYRCVSVFARLSKARMDLHSSAEIDILLAGFRTIVQSVFEEYFPCFSFDYRSNIEICILEVDKEIDNKIIEIAANKIFEELAQKLQDICIGIAVGPSCSAFDGLQGSFNESLTALRKIELEDNSVLIFSDDYEIKSNFIYTFKDENQLLESIKKGDKALVDEIIDDIVDINLKNGVSHVYIKKLFNELYNTVIRYAEHAGIPDVELPKTFSGINGNYNYITNMNLYDQYKIEIKGVCRTIIENSLLSGDEIRNDFVDKVLKYINENYQKDLYLDILAAQINISPKYLSRIFKDKAGINLSDYINEVRIEKAKYLLLNTETGVSRIAEDIGFIHRTTFLRVFKKIVGLSPSAFREINKIKEKSDNTF